MLALLLILIVVTAIRIRLLDFPLERDEGEFAYAAQLLLQGDSPYQHAYNTMLKLPGTCIAYALIMAVLGQTTIAIHSGVILVNLATAVLVFLLARRIYGDAAGVVAAGTYALLSINPETLGLAAHATHFVMLPALAGILLLQDLDERTSSSRIFFAGLLLGLAVIMKQSGAAFGLFAAVWVTWCELSSENRYWQRWFARLGWLAFGGILPFAFLCEILTLTGDFSNFWFWGVQYAQSHISVLTFGSSLRWMLDNIINQWRSASSLWSLALAGLIFLFFKNLCDAGDFSS
ncbi:MAG: glycosyltransferase family 39 protein [Limisphaerales bacterium]